MSMKYYAVRIGKKPGIYTTWAACQEQVHGFPGAQFKKFDTQEEAQHFIEGPEAVPEQNPEQLSDDEMVAYVDGSYNAKTGFFGYGIVAFTAGKAERFSGQAQTDDAKSRNVAGEVLAATKAMELAVDRGMKRLTLYYDYAGIRHWALAEWKANLPLTQRYRAYCASIQDRLELRFVKVAAHTGNPHNEEADRLAKKGCGILPNEEAV